MEVKQNRLDKWSNVWIQVTIPTELLECPSTIRNNASKLANVRIVAVLCPCKKGLIKTTKEPPHNTLHRFGLFANARHRQTPLVDALIKWFPLFR
jgi:hypothetical protein